MKKRLLLALAVGAIAVASFVTVASATVQPNYCAPKVCYEPN